MIAWVNGNHGRSEELVALVIRSGKSPKTVEDSGGGVRDDCLGAK
jgi:hypothetical protein